MRRSLFVVLAVVLALTAVAVTALAMGDGLDQQYEPAAPSQAVQLAVAHLAPFGTTTAVTVEVDGTEVLTSFAFGDSTGYLSLTSGEHTVAIYPAGSKTPALSETVNLVPGDYTAVAIGGANDWPLELLLLEDETTPGFFAKVRAGHLAPFADTMTDTLADIRLQDGTPVITDVAYGAVAAYQNLPGGTYDLKVTAPGGAPTLIDPWPATFANGEIVSVFAVGDGTNQPLGIFVLPSDEPGFFLDLTAYLQVAHLAPFAPDPGTAVDVEIDDVDVLSNFAFGDSTDYVELVAGVDHLVEIMPVGTDAAVLSATVNLEQAQGYTAIAHGGANGWPLALELLEDDLTPAGVGAKIRVGHLAPFTDTMMGTLADIRLQDGTPVITDVAYGAVTGYLPLPADIYDLKVTAPDGTPTLIDPMPATFEDGDLGSVFAVGDGTNQTLGIFVLPSDGPGFFLDLAAYLQVAHLAPFAPDPGTAVDVEIDDMEVLSNFAFADSTGYLPLEAGVDHLVEIMPVGTSSVVLSTTINLTHAHDFTALALGGANGWPLDLELLEDNNTPPAAGTFKLRLGHLAPFADTMTDTLAMVRLQDGTPLLPSSVPYPTIAPYAGLPAGTYDLKITNPAGTVTLIDPPPVLFQDGDILSAFAVGDGAYQNLDVFVLPSGEPGYLLGEATYVWMPIVMKAYTP